MSCGRPPEALSIAPIMQEDLENNVSETGNGNEAALDQEAEQSGETAEVGATNVEKTAPVVEAIAPEASASEGEPVPAERVPHRKTRVGVVVSDKMNKSIVVRVTRHVRHPLYKKYFFKSKKFMVHDENNECHVGDTVRIIETRPMSARKRWRLDTIVERAK